MCGLRSDNLHQSRSWIKTGKEAVGHNQLKSSDKTQVVVKKSIGQVRGKPFPRKNGFYWCLVD
jgi:hypothetical protein